MLKANGYLLELSWWEKLLGIDQVRVQNGQTWLLNVLFANTKA